MKQLTKQEVGVIYEFLIGVSGTEAVAPNCICGIDYYVNGKQVTESEINKYREEFISNYYGIARKKVEISSEIRL